MAPGWESEGWWFDPLHLGFNLWHLQATFDPRLPKKHLKYFQPFMKNYRYLQGLPHKRFKKIY